MFFCIIRRKGCKTTADGKAYEFCKAAKGKGVKVIELANSKKNPEINAYLRTSFIS